MTSGTSNTKYTSYFVSNNHAMGGGEPKAAEDQLKQDRIMKTGCHGDPQVSDHANGKSRSALTNYAGQLKRRQHGAVSP
jgi:hypothetical protein